MNKIEQIRLEIDQIDELIYTSFNKRMELIKEIKKIKSQNNINVTDSSRETLIINKNAKFIDQEFLKYYNSLVLEILKLSKEYQNEKI